jgi:predicted DCC family thiol-disulfide oxidoreductase YuxK
MAFYDGCCGLCAKARESLEAEATQLPITFLAYQSPEMAALFPELLALRPDQQIIVLADNGAIYQGDSAWLMLLWATDRWRSLAETLAAPAYRGLVKRVVTSISDRRLAISKLLGLRLPQAASPHPG